MLITIGIAITMLFAIATFSGCNDNSTIKEYRANAIAELRAHATEIGEDNFSTENWLVIQGHVEAGIVSINAAETKSLVRSARASAKSAINQVEQN